MYIIPLVSPTLPPQYMILFYFNYYSRSSMNLKNPSKLNLNIAIITTKSFRKSKQNPLENSKI